jgi:hypothetical protein
MVSVPRMAIVVFSFSLTGPYTSRSCDFYVQLRPFSERERTRTPKYNRGKKKGRSVEFRPFLSSGSAALQRAYGSN